MISVTAYFRIAGRAKAILAEVEAVVATWREEGRTLGMIGKDLESFADAFEHAERQAAQRVLR